jgi:Na+-driven multidrug efflux pump
MSVYTGQNVGAGKWDRVQKGVRQGSILAQSVSIVLVAALLLFGKYLFGIFTTTTELIDLAGQMMRIMAAGYVAISITQVLGGVMRGCGDTVTPMWISILNTVVLRLPTAYALAYFTRSAQWPNGHPFALSTSLLIAWVMGMVLSVLAFRYGKTRKMIRSEMEKQAK